MKKQLLLIVSVLSLNIAFSLNPSFHGTIILPNGPSSWSNSFTNLTLKGIKVINKQLVASKKMAAIIQKNSDIAEKSSQTIASSNSSVISFEDSSMYFVDTAGDYRSAGNGAWTSLSSWQYYNGSGWATPTVGQGYPGQFSGTNNVTIETGDTITIPNTFIMPEAIGDLSVHGILSMGNGTGSDREMTIKSNNVTIGANGNLFFNGSKVTLTLPNSNAVIIILSGGVITYGSCSVNNRIFIGTNLYSTCNGGGGSGVVAFGDVVASGGSINAEITNPVANPIDLCGTSSLNFTGKYIGSETNVDYVWTVRNPNNVTSTIASGSLANSSATTNMSFTPSSPGQYLISFQVTINSFTNIETRTVNVYSLLDYANLQFPASATICESESLTAYGQIYEAGVTEGSNGQAPNILAEFGYSSTDSNPNTWTNWMSAQFNTETGNNNNNDEYQYEFTPTSAGTYYYTFRYSINGCEWQYGGTNNGFWNGTGNNSGVLTVTPQSTWFADVDGDGFGSPDSSMQACNQPTNYVSDNSDCDDNNSAINPNAQEMCDGIDNDCNGAIDDNVATADSSLDTLTLSDGTLSPAFSANILSYSTEVCYNTNSITISATASNSNAVVTGAGNYNLVVGSNPLTITVDACGITTSYTINVTRLSNDTSLTSLSGTDLNLTPSFNSGMLNYSAQVCYAIASTNIGAIPNNPNAVVTGTGNFNLAVGSNLKTITVEACGFSTSYTIDIVRLSNDTSLSSLSASDVSLSPSFDPNTLSYSGSVCNATTSTTISAVANNPATTVTGTGIFSLNEGTNTFNVVVDTSCETRTYTITIFRSSLIDYANLQFPESETICQGNSTTAYGQVYESGLTDMSGTVVANIEAQFAINTINTNPATWSEGIWSNANPTPGYNFGQNNDEYFATFGSALSPGTYYYTFRYRLNGCVWQYGGHPNGFWNGTSQNNGILTVLENHTLGLSSGNTNQTVCPNSPISNIVYSFGGGTTSLAISPALPVGLNFNPNTGTLSGAPTEPGTYNYTVSTVGNSCSSQQLSGSINVKQLIDYGNLQFPGSATICSGGSIEAYGRIYEPGLTPNAGSPGAIVDAEYGYGNNPDPLTWTNWFDATYNVQVGNDDEYKATFGSTLAAGTYYYTFRYSLDGCEWQYGGYTSNGGGFLGGSNVVGVLTVNSAPVITNNYVNINVTTDPNMCGATVSYSAATTTGTPAPSISYSTPSGSLFSVGTTTVTVTATNECGTDTKTFTVTVIDNQAPTVVCQDITVPLDASGNASINASQLVSSSSDNCGIASVMASKTTFDCNDVTTSSNPITDLFFSEYVEGSSSNKYIEIYNGTGSDVDLSNYQLRLFANGSASATTTNTLSGTLTNGSTVVYRNSAATIYGGTSSVLSAVNWNGDDAIALWKISSNAAVDIFGRIGDDPGSAWTGTGSYSTVDKTLRRKSSVTQGINDNPTGTGAGAFTTLTTEWDMYNIDTVSGLGSHNTASSGPSGIPVTVTVTDVNGLSSTCTTTVTVVDNILPVISTNGDQTLNNDTELCGAVFTATASATDNCSVDAPVGVRDDSLPLNALYPVGTTIITWTAQDINGNNAAPVTQTITVTDNEVPTVVCQNTTIPLDANGNATITPQDVINGIATDNCTIASITISNDSFDCSNVSSGGASTGNQIWINEFHYDNASSDVGEFVEIAGTGGLNLSGYSVVFYNGSGGVTYDTAINLSGSIDNEGSGFGAISISKSGIQNGNPDGLALIGPGNQVIEFISYGGTFTATNGPAAGMLSTDIGLTESSSGPTGVSLQRIGTGNQASEFSWTGPLTASPGSLNAGQTIVTAGGSGIPVIVTVTDVNGNSTNCTAYVTVVDTIAPVITTNGNQNLNNGTGLCGAVFTATASATDNCSVDAPQGIRSDNQPLNAIYPVGTTTIAWNTTDVNGNDAEEVIQTIVVSDNEAPTVVCQNITVELDNTGFATITAAQLDGGSTDNCEIASISINDGNFDCSDLNVSEVASGSELFISEYHEAASGNEKFIEIYNPTSSSINLNNYQLVQYNNGSSTVSFSLNLTGTINANSTFVIANNLSTLYPSANLTTNNSVMGFNGNDIIALRKNGSNIDVIGVIGVDTNFAINVDLIRKSTILEPNTVYNALEWSSRPANNVSDLGVHTLSGSGGSGVPVILTVTDVNGNSANCTAYVTVIDNSAPTISCPGDIIQDSDIGICGATINYSITSNDNCAGYTVEQTAGLASGSIFPVGVTTNTFVVTDASGNTNTCSFNVTVNDTENPVAICPTDITVSNDPGQCGAVVNFNPSFTDNCAGGSVVASPASGSVFTVGTTTVTVTATDTAGNTDVCTFEVTVNDTENPVAICPANIIVSNDSGQCGAVVDFTPNFTDNCAGGSVVASPASGSVFTVGTTTVTVTATDTAGNTDVCTFEVTVNDTENPVAICPADITVSNDSGQCGAIVNFNPNFTDNCTGGSVVATPASGSFFNTGTTEVTVLATDAAGNINSCTFNITVNDTEAPLIACQDLQVYLNEQGNGSITAEQITQFATDNCEIATVTISQSNFDCSDIGGDLDDLIISEYVDGDNFENYIELFNGTGVTVDLTEYSLLVYYDGSSSPTTYPLGGSVNDRQTAVISHPDATYAAFLANNTALLTFDGNDAIALMHNGTIVDLLPVYNSGVSLVGTDLVRKPDVNNGNVSSATGSDGWTQNNGAPIANLGDHNIVFSDNENNVELTVTDTSGNSSTCIASVAVIDNTPPVIECQSITVQLDNTGNVSITADDIELSSSDACGISSLSLDKYDFACEDVGPNEVTLTVTDTNGNTTTCTATVTVVDDVDPVVNTQNITVQLNASGTVSITPNDVDSMSTDACGIQTLSVSPNSFTCSDVGQNTVTLTAIDVNGNSASATAIVTVEDNVVPVAICQNITVALDANGYASITGEDVNGGSTDACGIVSYSVSPSEFGCANIGANSVVLTVTDVNGNSSSCNATVTITGIVPSVTITESPLPEFCQGAVIVLTANTAQPQSDIRSYAWSGVGITGPTTGQSISVSGNGTYTVTVTSETNCSTTVSYTVTGFDAGALISSYTILANQEVFLHGNNLVQTGAVGATATSGLIKLHQATTVVGLGQAANFSLNQGSSVGTQINQPANPTIPAFVFNTQSNTNSPDVTINNGTSQTLTGSVYDVITVKQGATVTFSQSNVYINEIKTFENAKIEFSGCTNVYLNEKLMLARGGVINSAGNNVVFYVNEDVQIEQGSNVRARIHLNGHEILAKGANANGNNAAEPTYMTGLFIANTVHGNKNVIWNADTVCAPCATSSGGAQSPVANNNGFKLNAFTVSAWPNPSDTEFNIKLNTQNLNGKVEINVFDMNNKLVHTNSFNPNETYRFGKGLPGGVYVVRIIQGKDMAIERVVKY